MQELYFDKLKEKSSSLARELNLYEQTSNARVAIPAMIILVTLLKEPGFQQVIEMLDKNKFPAQAGIYRMSLTIDSRFCWNFGIAFLIS